MNNFDYTSYFHALIIHRGSREYLGPPLTFSERKEYIKNVCTEELYKYLTDPQ